MSYIVTTRFDNSTWQENRIYREKYNEPGCIYGPSRKMSEKIPLNSLVYVVEMNNSTNQIEGIGLIKNRIQFDKKYNIYDAGNYNRYTYTSEYRLDRSILDPRLIDLLDHILFKGKTHLKRGCGFTRIPDKLLKCEKEPTLCIGTESEIREEIKHLFKRYFSKNDIESDPTC